ncbi:MAG TPA: ATP-binding protein [Solirubrobacteraceae bacterium]|nr:ATP-binding protein [Solirubrobacteraceae bacterium]
MTPAGRLTSILLLRGPRPPTGAGVVAMVVLVALCTALIYPLTLVTTVSSLGVVYLLAVVIIATVWGWALALATAILSAAAFNLFQLPPIGRFTISDSRNWVALATFLAVAVLTCTVTEVARGRALEAERRRDEADLAAETAQLLLAGGTEEALALVGRRLAAVFGLEWATVTRSTVVDEPDHPVDEPTARGLPLPGRQVLPLPDGLGSLIVPAGLAPTKLQRLRERVIPALAAVLTVALERDRLTAATVQTEGLRRSEAVKTAVLRAVSHDLRSPVTAMVAAGAAVRAPGVSEPERRELGTLVVEEGARLSKLIDDLLDLSRLEADAASPRLAECSVDELIDSALAAQPREARFDVAIEPGVPPIQSDFVQVERALANLLDNARRFSAGLPILIRARACDERVAIEVVDRGPGIAPADAERIFEPFYRATMAGDSHPGSGLGLAIAKGFVEANGGEISVDSEGDAGTTFSVRLPVAIRDPRSMSAPTADPASLG